MAWCYNTIPWEQLGRATQKDGTGNMRWWLMECGGVLWVGEWWQMHMTPTTPVKDVPSITDMPNVIVVNVKPETLNRLDMLMTAGREI